MIEDLLNSIASRRRPTIFDYAPNRFSCQCHQVNQYISTIWYGMIWYDVMWCEMIWWTCILPSDISLRGNLLALVAVIISIEIHPAESFDLFIDSQLFFSSWRLMTYRYQGLLIHLPVSRARYTIIMIIIFIIVNNNNTNKINNNDNK